MQKKNRNRVAYQKRKLTENQLENENEVKNEAEK